MDRPAVRDAALLIFRAVLGVVFVAHGVDKVFFTKMTATSAQFAQWGIPQPTMSAWVCALVEMICGALLVVGLLATAAAFILALLAGAAGYFVHLSHGFFWAESGFEYTLVLVTSLLMIVVFGAGRASLDEVLSHVES